MHQLKQENISLVCYLFYTLYYLKHLIVHLKMGCVDGKIIKIPLVSKGENGRFTTAPMALMPNSKDNKMTSTTQVEMVGCNTLCVVQEYALSVISITVI